MSQEDPTTPDPRWDELAADQRNSTQPLPPADAQTRRRFLRAAVIGSTAVVAAAGATAVVAGPLRPSFLGSVHVAQAAFSNPATCCELIEGNKDAGNSNSNLIIDISCADNFPINTCIIVTSSTGDPKDVPFLTQISGAGMLKTGTTTHWQLPINPPLPVMGNFPSHSTVCQRHCS